MLKALYDYAIRNHLSLPPGFINKSIKAYISLSAKGEFLGFVLTESGEEVPCPDIGSLANGTDKCNVTVEKRSVVIPETETAKSRFFRETMKAASAAVPICSVCLQALEDEETVVRIRHEADARKIKPGDRLGFMVDGISILDSPDLPSWWKEYRRRFCDVGNARKTLCLITGEPTVPMRTAPSIKGLRVVGGHASGDSLICFDKAAFCSFDLAQAANAPVSEEAFSAVKAALDALLAKAPVLAGMKFVHWYDRPVERCDDLLASLFSGFSDEDDDGETTAEEVSEEDRIAVQNHADRLVNSVASGMRVPPPDGKYYILLLSGVGGRIMIRRWEHGSYDALQRNLDRWQDDLSLADLSGTGQVKPYKLVVRMIRLITKQKNDRKVFDRLQNELPGITPAVITAIIGGGALPDAVAARSLSNIRSQMLEQNDDTASPQIPDAICCQWLKAWLLRKNKEVGLMSHYNPGLAVPAYHCGAIMAVYAAIQSTSMPDVNAGIIQRYYASACQTPALVIGRLSILSVHHMDKIDRKWQVKLFTDMLDKAYCGVGEEMPVTLNLEQQSYFALGYRQMSVELNREINEKRAEFREKYAAKPEQNIAEEDDE